MEREDTVVLSANFRRVVSLSLGMKQVCSRKFSIPSWFMCSVNFLFMTSRTTGTGILVKRALTSKDAKVSSGATFWSFRHWLVQHTFSGNCSPVSHLLLVIAVQHMIVHSQVSSQFAIQKLSNVTPFGYINCTPLGHKSFRSFLLTVKG